MRISDKWITPFTKQCFVTAGVTLNKAGLSLVIGFTTNLLQQLKEPGSPIPLDLSSGSWIAAIPGISLILGNLMAPSIMAKYGRKNANIISILPVFTGWVMIYFAKSFSVLFLARFLQGIGMGMCMSLGSVLIGEYTSPKNRGMFLMTISVSIAAAVISVHTLGSYLTWQNTALICSILAMVDMCIVVSSPESPGWLAAKGRYEGCETSFRWLRGDKEDEELHKMIEASMALRKEKVSTKSMSLAEKLKSKIDYIKIAFGKKELYKPFIIMIHIYTLSQFNGINVLVAFPIDLFKIVVGPDANMPMLMMSIDGHRLIANTLALLIIRKIKRRTLLFTTVTLNILALLAVAGYSLAIQYSLILASDYRAVGIFLVHVHMFSVATGSLPFAFVISGEIFPLQYRSLAGISVVFYSLFIFTTIKTIPILLSSVGLHGTYLIYASVMVYCLVVVYFQLPETKDRTLQDIEDEFRGKEKEGKRVEVHSVADVMEGSVH